MTFWDQSLFELFRKGGFAMWPLLVCSVIGLAIIVERTIYFLRLRLDYGKFVKTLIELLARHKLRDALSRCRRHPNPVARIAGEYLSNLEEDGLRNELLRREGSYALERVESRLRVLAAITHIAPLLGLLGTVTGLVTAFHKIELLGGQVQPGDLAAGIWEALITTVYGLVIAIPCMAAYHGFESVADKIARRMQFVIAELDGYFGKKSSGDFKSQDIEATEETMRAFQ